MQANSQRIDWLTMEIEPVIEAQVGPVTAEYSHVVRSFEQNDQIVSRAYDGHPVEFVDPTAQHIFAFVPENITQIDKLKLRADLTDCTAVYTNLFVGDTKNRYRDTHRHFGGADGRIMNTSFDGLTLTGYGKWYEETNQVPTFFPEDNEFPPGEMPSEEVRHPADRRKMNVGSQGAVATVPIRLLVAARIGLHGRLRVLLDRTQFRDVSYWA